MEDIEDERFDLEFTVVAITKKDKEFFVNEINSVAEISNVEVTQVLPQHLDVETEKDDNSTEAEISGTTDKTQDENQPVVRTHKTNKPVRVDIERLDTLMNLVSELIIIKNSLEASFENVDIDTDSIEYLERITTSIHDAVMKVRMVPIEQVFNRFPRMIRDISRELDKDIELHMVGAETELDRTPY